VDPRRDPARPKRPPLRAGLVKRDAGKRDCQPFAALFWPGHTAFFGPDPQAVKTIVQRESRHWIHSMNGRVRPFALIAAFSSGVTHKINHGF
jgi:hypothetical protein